MLANARHALALSPTVIPALTKVLVLSVKANILLMEYNVRLALALSPAVIPALTKTHALSVKVNML